MIWNLRSALHLDLERFYHRISPDLSAPDPSAFSKARRHLKPSAFRSLNDQLMDVAKDHGLRDDRWNGLRLMAVDGSTLRLPKGSKDIGDHFGGLNSRHGTFTPMARMSFLYEVRSKLIVDGRISRYEGGEGEQACELLDGSVCPEDCILFDRGYNEHKVMARVIAQKSNFVMRVAVGGSKAAKVFLESGKEEALIDLRFHHNLIEQLGEVGLTLPETVKLRLIRVLLDTGEVEVLLTNLIDKGRYPRKEFKALYHERWGIEEGIKNFKCKIEIENWTGKSAVSVEQDFYARIVSMNIAVSLGQSAQALLDKKTEQCEHRYSINIKRSIGIIRDEIFGLLQLVNERAGKTFQKLTNRLIRSASIIRPGRSYIRTECKRIPAAAPYKPVS